MSTSKLLGTAVGVALENREALKTIGAPAVNVAGGALQVIFRTFWKSLAVGAGVVVVWIAAFISTYILGGTNVMLAPAVTGLLGLSLFIIIPAIIFARESRRVSKAVAAKNKAQRFAAEQEKARRAAEQEQKERELQEQQAQAQAQWVAFQQFQAQQAQSQWAAFQQAQAQRQL